VKWGRKKPKKTQNLHVSGPLRLFRLPSIKKIKKEVAITLPANLVYVLNGN